MLLTKKAAVPVGLRPYLFHGMDLTWREGDSNATGACPQCGHQTKFSVSAETTKFQCWPCGFTGNAIEWLRWLWQARCR